MRFAPLSREEIPDNLELPCIISLSSFSRSPCSAHSPERHGPSNRCGQGRPRAAGKASRRTSVPGLGFVEKANLCLTGCYIIASAILIYALASYDFSLVYVASYTDRLLPLFYRITAFWAGQAGSMLFWAFSVAICGRAVPAYPLL